ncbi:MAG: radical SAM protein [Thermomicrobiales bacterium]|nr:MAG: radical SAM protein [Thermomicrobiales bacterium]
MIDLGSQTMLQSLAQEGGIVLISCYELGHQPLSLASPMAHLRAAGFRPVAIDAAIEPINAKVVRQAALIAISVPMHTALRLGVRVAEQARALNPQAHLSFYGLYAVLNASYLLRTLADSVIGGEYEPALVGLAQALAAGEPLENVPGVSTAHRLAPPRLTPPAFLPPVRDCLPSVTRYARLERDGVAVPAGYVETTRGCHHTCAHCPITPVYNGQFVVIPRDVVLADARAQIEVGARHLTFGDPDFFNGPGHGMRILRSLHADFPDISFDVTIKIEHLIQHRRLLPELAELGCAFIVSAVESLSNRVLAHLQKGHTRADVEKALELLDAAGIPMRPSLLPFTPWATLADYLELLTWVARNDLQEHVDPVHFSIRLLVPPGSALLQSSDSNSWLQTLDEASFTYRWVHPDPRMEALQREVAGIAERASMTRAKPRETFAEIWEMAYRVAGIPTPPLPAPVKRRPRPPRLTEDWFC